MQNAKYNEQGQLEEEMREILHSNTNPVYILTSVNEPTFIREYAHIPLEDHRNTTQPSAPTIHQPNLTTDSYYRAADKMYRSLAN